MIKIIVKTPAVYYRGLHDRESSEFGYKSRNQKKSIPEVTKCGNGEVYSLTEAVEWLVLVVGVALSVFSKQWRKFKNLESKHAKQCRVYQQIRINY